jgi:hypothetical protein
MQIYFARPVIHSLSTGLNYEERNNYKLADCHANGLAIFRVCSLPYLSRRCRSNAIQRELWNVVQ